MLRYFLFGLGVCSAGFFAFGFAHWAVLANAQTLDLDGFAWSSHIGWLSMGCIPPASPAQLKVGKITGYAWSANVGWISFSGSNYEVKVDEKTGQFSGHAWSSNLGWLSFERSETGPPPAEPFQTGVDYIAKFDKTTGAITGWARFLNHGAGWDGWVKLRGPGYGVELDPGTGVLQGYAWGTEPVGWIRFQLPTTACNNRYGVSLDTKTGNLSGFAWSSNAGWLNFDPPGPYPGPPDHSALVATTSPTAGTSSVSGWARFENGRTAGVGTGKFEGYAWSANIGWISLASPEAGAAGVTYQVQLNPATGVLSGHAWSSNLGWLSFERSETGPPPAEPFQTGVDYIAKLDSTTNQLIGWARALGGTGDRWIKLSGPGYGVSVNETGGLSGFAWGEPPIGWIKFQPGYANVDIRTSLWDGWVKLSGNWQNGVTFDNARGTFSGYAWGSDGVGWLDFSRVHLANKLPNPPSDLQLTQNYCSPGADVWTYNFSWTFSDPDANDQQGAYRLQIALASDPEFQEPVCDTGKVMAQSTSPSLLFGVDPSSACPNGLRYNTTYLWRVMVWDSRGGDSLWSSAAPSFTTPRHAYPKVAFSWSPPEPVAQEEIQFIDQTVFAPGSTGPTWQWTWTNGDPQPAATTTPNPTMLFMTDTKNALAKLTVADDAGQCSLERKLNIGKAVPFYEEK